MKKIQTTKVKVDMPVKLVNVIDVAAARELTSRAAWVRLAVMDRAVRDGLIHLAQPEDVSAYDAEMARVFG